jgi:transposase
MVTKTRKRKFAGSKKRFVGKPTGQIQERVQAVGPEHFGIVAVDCAKRRSKWMLCNFYGKVLIEPTSVEHTTGGLRAMTQSVAEACQAEGLTDTIVAVEMTGIYHKPAQRAFRKAGFETRIVHPFASSHYRRPLHPDAKTDDHDLEAIFHAAVKGYGLATLPVGEIYQSLQAVSRHRHNLVKQRARLMVQIRRLLHQTMPGFDDLFEDDKLFHKSIGLPIAWKFSSAEAIRRAGVAGIASHLSETKVRFQTRTIERIVAWAGAAAAPAELAAMYTGQWQQLDEVRRLWEEQIAAAEREMAGFLVKTPYILLLSVTGINVVSAARLAGEAGPIERPGTRQNRLPGTPPRRGPSTDEPVSILRGIKVMKSIVPTARWFASATASCAERQCWCRKPDQVPSVLSRLVGAVDAAEGRSTRPPLPHRQPSDADGLSTRGWTPTVARQRRRS